MKTQGHVQQGWSSTVSKIKTGYNRRSHCHRLLLHDSLFQNKVSTKVKLLQCWIVEVDDGNNQSKEQPVTDETGIHLAP